MIAAGLLLIAATLLLSHYGPSIGRWLIRKEPRLVAQLQAIEAGARSTVSTIEKDTAMVSDTVQQKLSHLGAALLALKTRAETAEAALPAKQAELDAANAHIADLTSQLAATTQNLADTEGAVGALADQAGQ